MPYRRIGGASGEIGCQAPHSVATIGGQVFWLGTSKAGVNQIFMSQGYTPVVISTHAISYQLSKLGDTSDAVAFCYQQENHIFYVLTLVGGNKTFVYDVTEGEWFNQTTRTALVNKQNRWAVIFAVTAYSTILCGMSSTSSENSLVLELSLDKFDDWDGRPIVRTAQGVHLWDDLKNVFYRELRVDCDVKAVQNGQGSNPVLMMSFSDDGGNTFTSERTRSIGKVGDYLHQVSWLFLGSSRNRVFRFTYSDPVFLSIGGVRAITDQSNAY